MADNSQEPSRGFFEKLRPFVRDAVEKSYPASAITLIALRNSKPDLAKRIFVEAVIAPAKAAIAGYITPSTLKLFEELESRFRQDDITRLFYEVEIIVASRMIAEMFVRLTPMHEAMFQQPVRGLQGMLTPIGADLAWHLSMIVRPAIAELVALRERRVQLLLVAEVAGADAVTATMEEFAGYKRDSFMESVWQWLGLQNLDDGTRKRFADFIAAGSDERIAAVQQKLEGCAFLGKETVEQMIDEIFTGEEHIEF
jgi:hypothetical protein